MLTLRPHDRILFQGDSITDAFRVKDPGEPHDCYLLGAGYAGRIAGDLRAAHPGMGLRFFNRGISGEGVNELLKRWTIDTLCLEPDVLSLLVGINDTSPHKQQTPEQWEAAYRELIDQTRSALPGVRLILLEPFGLPHGAHGAEQRANLEARQPIVRKIAESVGATFVPLQERFDRAVADHDAPPTHWTLDGIHPSSAGHVLIAEAWKSAVQIG